jgi:hypothetical protein
LSVLLSVRRRRTPGKRRPSSPPSCTRRLCGREQYSYNCTSVRLLTNCRASVLLRRLHWQRFVSQRKRGLGRLDGRPFQSSDHMRSTAAAQMTAPTTIRTQSTSRTANMLPCVPVLASLVSPRLADTLPRRSSGLCSRAGQRPEQQAHEFCHSGQRRSVGRRMQPHKRDERRGRVPSAAKTRAAR